MVQVPARVVRAMGLTSLSGAELCGLLPVPAADAGRVPAAPADVRRHSGGALREPGGAGTSADVHIL